MVAVLILSGLFFGVLFGWACEHTKQQILVQINQHFIHKITLHDEKMGVYAPTNFVCTQIELCMLYVYNLMAGGWEKIIMLCKHTLQVCASFLVL
jgi:hypothetical protein